MPRKPTLLLVFSSFLLSAQAYAEGAFSVPLSERPSGGYYVRGVFPDSVESDLLVDTGSSYVVLSEGTFSTLKRKGAALFVGTISGIVATGRRVEAKVYLVSELALGSTCVLHDIEVVALPGADQDILGLSALRRLQPILLNLESQELVASACISSRG